MRLAKPKRKISKKVDKNRKRLTLDELKTAIRKMQDMPIIIRPANTEVTILPAPLFFQRMLPKSLQLLNKLKQLRK